MNYIVTARPMYLPISADRAVTRPITAVADAASDFRDASQQQPSGYVYRGELLETANERAYRPQYNLQISPENRRAITTYQQVAAEPAIVGRILDGFI